VQVCLLRVGIDTGSGGILGPLFRDNTFEYVPIPEGKNELGRIYGEIVGKNTKKPLWTFFPKARQDEIRTTAAHCDPEFDTFTYGDPTRPKLSLRKLQSGDLLVFYAGLEPYAFKDERKRGLYVIGYFEVKAAGLRADFPKSDLKKLFWNNHHFRYRENERGLILVKGSTKSRLLKRAHLISKNGRDRAGKNVYVLSDQAKRHLGNFTKLNGIQRSIPRWVSSEMVSAATEWVRHLD
jgi:hypothetical protein